MISGFWFSLSHHAPRRVTAGPGATIDALRRLHAKITERSEAGTTGYHHASPSKLSEDTKLMFHSDEEIVGKLVIEKLTCG